MEVSKHAALKIANGISDLRSCVDLATQLNMDSDYIGRLAATNFNNMTAFHLLSDWQSRFGERATGDVLYQALCRINLRELAVRNAEALLGKGRCVQVR